MDSHLSVGRVVIGFKPLMPAKRSSVEVLITVTVLNY